MNTTDAPDRVDATKRKHPVADEVFRIFAPVAIVAAGIGGFLVLGQRPQAAPRETPRDSAAVVETSLVEPTEGHFTIEVDGVALSYRRVTHSAEVAGRVTQQIKDCRGGHYVESGQFLLEIDPTDYQLEIERLNVQIEQADENLAEAEIEIENTAALIELAKEDLKLEQQNLARVQRLISNSATTDTQLDTARMQELDSRHALQSLENQLSLMQQRKNTLQAAKRLAQTALKRAELDVARTRVSAPLSGTLVAVEVEEGDYVKQGDPLFTINDTQTMEISCQLRVDELYWIWLQAGTFSPGNGLEARQANGRETFEIPNVAVEVAFPFRGTEYLWSGVLSRYDGTGLDPSTRTIPCRVRVDAPTEVRVGGNGVVGAVSPPTLFSGMYVKIRIPVETPVPMLRIPLTALRPGGEVWLERDGQLTIAPVEVARKEGDSALLLVKSGGPRANDRVITSPLAAVEEGMLVRDITLVSRAQSAATEADIPPAEDSPSSVADRGIPHEGGLGTEVQP